MAPSDVHARRVGRHERAGDAQVLLVTEEVIGVVEPEGEAEERRHRPERDVALVPGDAHAEHFFALPRAFANHGVVRDGRSVGARLRVSQRETGNLVALRKAREVIVFLRIGAVVEQQLRRPERVRHHHADRRGARARRELHHHRRMRERAEAEAAVLLRDDHAEEALVLDVLPDLRRQILQLVADLPVVAHGAELLHRPVEERLLLRREARRAQREQLVPVRPTREEIGVPPDGAGVDRFFFRLRHIRQDPPIERQHVVDDRPAAQPWHVQQRGERQEHGREHDVAREAECRDDAQIGEQRGGGDCPGEDRRAEIGEEEEGGDRCEDEDRHGGSPQAALRITFLSGAFSPAVRNAVRRSSRSRAS